MALVIVLAVALGALAVLVVLVLALIRHLKVLALSLQRFQEETRPVLLDIQRGSDAAQGRMQRLSERAGGRLRT